MGVLGSAPFAAGQPGGVVNVFGKGSADGHLWQARYRDGAGLGRPTWAARSADRQGARLILKDYEKGRDQGHLQGPVRYT